jgi:hypothetical protein
MPAMRFAKISEMNAPMSIIYMGAQSTQQIDYSFVIRGCHPVPAL